MTTTTPPITGGKEAWVGSGAPKRPHPEASRLKVKSGTHYTFIKRHSPVPLGDQVGVGKLRVTVAAAATGTFTLKARRVASRIDWSELTYDSMPGVTGSSQPTVTVTNPTKGQVLEFNVATHLQTVAGGDPHYGWRIESDSSTMLVLYGEGDFPPELYVEYSATPATATDLAPSGVISGTKPVVTASADDVTGEDEVSKVRWQLDAASDPVSPDYDSAWVDSTVLELDLARTDLPGGVFAGISVGATIYQRMQWRNDSGNDSAWSDWYPITRKTKRTLTITNPGVGGVVTDVTPQLLATVSGPIETYRVRVLDAAEPSKILASSGKVQAAGTTLSYAVPKAKKLRYGGNYIAEFYSWDDEARVSASDDPRYVLATQAFTVTDVPGVEAPVIVSVTEHPSLPANVVRVTTSETPDTFTLLRDDEEYDALIDPADVVVSGTTYDLLDPQYTWMEPHTYTVRAVVNGEQSVPSNAVTVSHTPTDVWIVDPGKNQWFMLEGTGIDDWGRVDKAGVYQVHGDDLSIVIKAGSSGYTGSFKGSMRAAHGRTLDQLRKHLKAIQGRESRPVLLRAANLSLPVILLDLSCLPHPETRLSNPRDQVSFRLVQAPALPEN